MQPARARFAEHTPDQLGRHPFALKAGQRVERRDLARVLAPVGLGQQRDDPGQMLVADPVAEARRQQACNLLVGPRQQKAVLLPAMDQRLDFLEIVDQTGRTSPY